MNDTLQTLMDLLGLNTDTPQQKAAKYKAQAEAELAARAASAAQAPVAGPGAVPAPQGASTLGGGAVQPAPLGQVGGARRKQLQQIEDLLNQ